MKNVTKANVLFTSTVLVYMILVYTIRLLPADLFSFNVLLVLPEFILLIPSVFYLVFLRKDALDNNGYQKVSFFTVSMTVLFTFCMIPVVTLINMISTLFVENSVSGTVDYIVENNSIIINLIILALVPAVVEEFIFRGLIFNGYKKRNPLKAALLSAMLFGLIHLNINQFSYAFVLGIVFALMTYVTGSIIPSTIAHFIVNGTTVVLSHLLANLNTENVNANTEVAVQQLSEEALLIIVFLMYTMFAIAGISIGGVIFYFICKKNRGIESFKMIFKKPLRNNYDKTQGRFFDGYLLLGVGICVIYMITYEFIV